jgi:hypothetical protein
LGRGARFSESRITHDGCGYTRQAQILSDGKADKANLERNTAFESLLEQVVYQAAVIVERQSNMRVSEKRAPRPKPNRIY